MTTHAPRSYIYTRVSTPEQNTLSQLQEFPADVLAAVPEQRIVAEVVSGKVLALERQGFAQLLLKLERGDSLYVAKLDRLGRNTADVLATVERLTKEGIKLHCINMGGADLTSASGKLMLTVLAAVAEMERELISERTVAGQARAWAEGKQKGRKAVLTPEQVLEIRQKKLNGDSFRALAGVYGVGVGTIQRACAEDGGSDA